MSSKKNIILIIRLGIFIASWMALIIRLWLSYLYIMEGGDPVTYYGNMFSYFTIQTNLMVLIWITIALIYSNKDNKPRILNPLIHGAIALYISVTFIIFALLLSVYYQPTGIEAITNILMHYAIPIAFILDWFISESDVKYEYRYLIYYLIYPFVYLAYSLVRGIFTGFYPYFFIDLNYISIVELIISVIALMVFFLILGSIYFTINRAIYNKKN